MPKYDCNRCFVNSFDNLKQLYLHTWFNKCNMRRMISLLKHSPNLENLNIDIKEVILYLKVQTVLFDIRCKEKLRTCFCLLKQILTYYLSCTVILLFNGTSLCSTGWNFGLCTPCITRWCFIETRLMKINADCHKYTENLKLKTIKVV